MKRFLPLLFFAALLAACAVAAGPTAMPQHTPTSFVSATSTPSSSMPVDVPSDSCIFTLDVDNQSAAKVTVATNGIPLGDVAAYTAQRFYAVIDGNPPLPWAVVVTRTSDGAILAAKDFPDGTLSGTITMSDEPEMIAAGYCQ